MQTKFVLIVVFVMYLVYLSYERNIFLILSFNFRFCYSPSLVKEKTNSKEINVTFNYDHCRNKEFTVFRTAFEPTGSMTLHHANTYHVKNSTLNIFQLDSLLSERRKRIPHSSQTMYKQRHVLVLDISVFLLLVYSVVSSIPKNLQEILTIAVRPAVIAFIVRSVCPALLILNSPCNINPRNSAVILPVHRGPPRNGLGREPRPPYHGYVAVWKSIGGNGRCALYQLKFQVGARLA